jgi:uncharacterized protein (TIGR03437 family)
VTLQPGEVRTVQFALPVSDLEFWDVRKSRFTVEQGRLDVLVGASSADIRQSGMIAVMGDVLAPRPAAAVTRAENYDEYSGIQLTRSGDGRQVVGHIENGDWVLYRHMEFGAGVTRMEASVSSGGNGGTIDVHLDSLEGPLAGSCTVAPTGGWFSWTTIDCPHVEASGPHDVYLLFHGSGNGLFNLDWFRFGADGATVPALDGAAVDAAGYSQPLLRGSWGSVWGRNLAATSRQWSGDDFQGLQMPLSLDGTRVNISGVNAPVYYISPTQVNFQVPEQLTLGPGVLQVINSAGSSRPVAVTIGEAQPAFYTWNLGGRTWVAAQHSDYSLICLPELLAATPARPGETILLWGSGFGQTWPPFVPGVAMTSPAALADPGGLTVKIGNAVAPIQYSGMTIAGVYQINVVVPDLANGEYAVTATVGGRSTQAVAYLAVRR